MIARAFFQVLSYLFHPLLMPVLGVFLLFSIQTRPITYYKLDALWYFPWEAKKFIYIIIIILTVVSPVLSLLIMYYNKMISSLELSNQKERAFPFVLVIFYYLLAYIYVRYQFPPVLAHPALYGFLFGILTLFIACFIINFFVKISLHSAGIFGICGMLIGYSQTQLPPALEGGVTNLYIILYLIFVAGLVSTGRLFLKAHTLQEILLGIFTGFSIMFVTVKYGIFI